MVKNCNISSFLSSYNKKTFTELSENDETGESLVNNTNLGYDFDSISEGIFGTNKLRSADSVIVKDDYIIFIEFKSGFKKRIHISNFDKSKWPCKHAEPYCSEGAEYFLKNQDLTAIEMIQSIQLKAVESFITLEKFIVPKCFEENNNWKVKFVAVIDAVNDIPLDMYEAGLSELGGCDEETLKENSIVSLKDSLKKYMKKNFNGDGVLYDSVDVMTVENFNMAF